MECRLKDIVIHYEEHGEGEPALLLHGFEPDHRLMTGCMEPVFARRGGWRRIYPDLPGMGRTRGEDWITSSDQMLEVVLAFIDRLIPGKRFLLAGESYGGYLARGVVHRRPELVRGLLLICPVVIADPARRAVPQHVALVSDPELIGTIERDYAGQFESIAVVQTPRTWQRSRDEIISGIAVADLAFLSRIRSTGYAFSFDVDPPDRRFDRPALIISGRQDSSVGYRDAWDIIEHYPRGTFAVLDRAGHNLQIEQEDLFNALVNEWLDRVEESAARAAGSV